MVEFIKRWLWIAFAILLCMAALALLILSDLFFGYFGPIVLVFGVFLVPHFIERLYRRIKGNKEE